MNFQDVQLTPLIINELYRDLLVEIEDADAPLPKWTPKPQAMETLEMEVESPANKSAPIADPVFSTGTKPTPGTEPAFNPAQKKSVPDNAAVSGKSTPDTAPASNKSASDTAPVLIDIPVTKTASTDSQTTGANGRIKFLGGNQKRIAFIVNSTTDVYLPDAHLDWLRKMLEACRLNLGDVAIANIAKNTFTITDIKQELFSNTVILLGAEPSSIQLPINFPQFNLHQHDGVTFLATPPPAQLNQSTNEAKLLKSKLWVSLQKLFKL